LSCDVFPVFSASSSFRGSSKKTEEDNFMKKFIGIVLVLALSLSVFAACGTDVSVLEERIT